VVVGALTVVGVVFVDVVFVTAVVTDTCDVVASFWFLTTEFCVQFVTSQKAAASSQMYL
jgi:hypothetical protein